jgi:hypothetical protein
MRVFISSSFLMNRHEKPLSWSHEEARFWP